MLVLKPFLFKNTVWGFGNAVNTQDLSIHVSNTSHAIFRGLTDNAGDVQLFSACNTNAVTAINGWENASGQIELASPVSQPAYSTVTEFPAGASVGGTTFSSTMLMIGVSEYSTANITDAGLKLIENAIYYLLGMDIPAGVQAIEQTEVPVRKYILNGQLFIERNGIRYSITGQRL